MPSPPASPPATMQFEPLRNRYRKLPSPAGHTNPNPPSEDLDGAAAPSVNITPFPKSMRRLPSRPARASTKGDGFTLTTAASEPLLPSSSPAAASRGRQQGPYRQTLTPGALQRKQGAGGMGSRESALAAPGLTLPLASSIHPRDAG